MNELMRYLDMYDSQMGRPGNAYVKAPRNAISQLGAAPVRDDNAGARRMMFAERMLRQQQPQDGGDFFSGNSVPMPQMEQRPMRQPMQRNPQIDNYLARLMGGMNGR
jgi:hypothetical protein